MAVLAPQDWHPPRDLQMDAPSNSINAAAPRQRSSPANDPSSTASPPGQQPYPYPVQQQQAGWSPHPQQQYYPSFYQNPHQQPYALHGHPAQGQMHPQNAYYDPANAQFAQWAYQQMIYSAHQHQMSHVPSPHPGQRSRTGSASTGDYFVPGQMGGYSPFPSGTPPAHPSQLPNGYSPGQGDHSGHQSQYNGFHPYRRPNRQGSHNQESSQPSPGADWRGAPPAGSFQPPYIRADAAGSSTSVNSASSNSGSSRQRTNSMQGTSNTTGSRSPPANGHGRGGSANSSSSTPSNSSRPHQRTTSTSSNGSSTAPRPSAASSSASPAALASATLRKPSPLSQGTFTAAEKRMSRDDSDLTAMLEPAPGVRSGGLKGRLRRALSLNAGAALREEDEDEHSKSLSRHTPTSSAAGSISMTVAGDDESTATVQKKKSKSLFNSRLNRSTDNISLSSTMSSASMVIRKLGNIGKLTRRNSLAGITSLFKDKKDKEEADGKKGKKKKDGKSSASEPSVSMATAELDPGEWTPEMTGLSPAARLARQHTLKTNAEAAAKAKAEAEAKAKAAAQGDPNFSTTWEKNTTTRQGDGPPARGLSRVNDDGTRVLVEDDDSDSDGGPYNQTMDGWDEDDDDWGEAQDEDTTLRQSLEGVRLEDDGEMEPWALGVRRSVERTRRPAKGILKNGSAYDQDTIVGPNPPFGRNRSNSYDSTPAHNSDLGPLARIPSPDPDHIDGLHRHSHSSGSTSFIPPLAFEGKGATESPKDVEGANAARSPTPDKVLFSHPNSSAPALSTVFSTNPPTLSHRSATAPAKRLAFATNLSVYDTFPATVYDRRSEPATWSRLTPALAQRIKEELNSYKMEEMEVHAASRVHTQFFV